MKKKRALIIGAGKGSRQILKNMKSLSELPFQILGLLDDDPQMKKKSIYGFKILGNISQLETICRNLQIRIILIAIPSASSSLIKKIVNQCEALKIQVKTLPAVGELLKQYLECRVNIQDFRSITLADLVGRESLRTPNEQLARIIKNKTVLLTGAGGSIGSELGKQLVKYNPSQLILLDKNEFFLYTIERKLNEIGRKCKIIPFLADIKNAKSLQKLFKAYSPQIVIHAAAYKHVPMMESFPFEAVENNVLGTYNVIHYSRRFQAARIVIISTDKAVNPTCVMGATKRLSEMIAKSISNEEREHKNKKSKIMIVRFGNVLGSNGSVIPLFTEQIVNGLPVTVTHKDVTRYFMSIEEAAHLVLEAAVMGKGGEIFTLDMGKPVKILDLAREMISLNGLIPDKDIKIKFIGLRPGEKLEEELFFNNENRLPTHHPKIMIAQNGYQKSTIYKQVIQWIDTIDPFTSDVKIKDKLQKFIPEYHPSKRS